ncbi:MAG TPA: hypothetical protein VGN14_09625 [Candidatus Elarobacter sp.]|jgi:hypothetical protein
MIRTAATLALALVLALPGAALAKKHASPAPAAAGSGALSATPVTCPASDPVVWVNTSSKIYWAAGTEYYGKTKHGGYACTSAAVAMGARAPKASPMMKRASTPVPVRTP